MKVLGYGEDGLTVWALRDELRFILRALGDRTDPSTCDVFYRPSFGRAGGPTSSQFGEPDFLVLVDAAVYLGECKWDNSPHTPSPFYERSLDLEEVQILRQAYFAEYVDLWLSTPFHDWATFHGTMPIVGATKGRKPIHGLSLSHKPIPDAGSGLAATLEQILQAIQRRYTQRPPITNVLLYFHNCQTIPTAFGPLPSGNNASKNSQHPWRYEFRLGSILRYWQDPSPPNTPAALTAQTFRLVPINYAAAKDGVFIPLYL
jgi:hypothetical protein